MDERGAFGRAGEELAARLYRGEGYAVIESNFRCELGEVDLIVRRGSTLVFCEVKARHSDAFGLPSEAVGRAKQQRLRRLAARWLAERNPGRVEVRFDVVSVIVRNGRGEATRVEDAF